MGCPSMDGIPLRVLLAVTVVLERWLIGTTREVSPRVGAAGDSATAGSAGGRLSALSSRAGLAVAACGMILATIRSWRCRSPASARSATRLRRAAAEPGA